jgi:bifunctional non-homologous end joining protein LigD
MERPEYPDRLVFDLDPPDEAFEPVRYTAFVLREFLREVGLDSFVMITGSRGLHVTVPLDGTADFNIAGKFAQDMADVLIRLEPDFFTTELLLEERNNRVFIDTGRNAYGQTVVAPYAVRTLPGAPVATPVDWGDLKSRSLNARTYTIKNIFSMLDQRGDAWNEIFLKAYSLDKPQRRLKKI